LEIFVRTVVIDALVPDRAPREVFDRISDLERYPEYTDAVRSVQVEAIDEGQAATLLSHWEVVFRNGIMRWSERDTFDVAELSIEFEQTAGDFETFTGRWLVEPGEEGTAVRFVAEFDLGLPTIAEIIDPIAESTLRNNIARILGGLLPGVLVLAPAEPDLAAEPAGERGGGR
jgi:ribosome-associated toxin RatA of RatAB toxin-antitoxin module